MNPLQKLNRWYDSLPEPFRFLTFFVPFVICHLIVTIFFVHYILMWMLVLVLVATACRWTTISKQ